MDYESIQRKLQANICWLSYASLVDAIPPRWWRILGQKVSEGQDYEWLSVKFKNTNRFLVLAYNLLTSKPCIFMSSYNSWLPYMDETMTVEEFKKALTGYRKVTISTKLRDFQYRLIHKRIPTNKELKRWKLKEASTCDWCGEEDSIKHLMFECKLTRQTIEVFA